MQRLPSPFRHYELTPAQTRFIFTHKGWSRIVGFHTRNAAHRVHQFMQFKALDDTDADGLYINPIIGPKKPGDFLPYPIMRSYQVLLETGAYPENRVVLGSFATYSRYAGPREAVFTALCRKNMGCSHFIVGRDHTGVSDYYSPEANRKFFDEIGDIGITPVFFDAIGYNAKTGTYNLLSAAEVVNSISGTEARQRLSRGERLPDWYMHDAVQDMLLNEIRRNRPVFCE